MKYKDYYAVLGVPRDADLDAIKKAYRKLARENHPDVAKATGSEERFKEAAEAYATLKDPEKRAAYDQLGTQRAGDEFAPPPQWNEGAFDATGFEGVDLADLMEALGRGRAGARRAPTPRRGADYETNVRLTLEQAHQGATLNLDVAHEDGGRTLEVSIPAGVTSGQRIRLRGKGGKGREGAADGDIYLNVQLAPHAVFRADGHDLYFDLALTPWEAALGADVEVPTLDGPVLLTVPAGTRSARRLRVRGRGMAKGPAGRGDLYAVAHIDVPATLTAEERDLFEQLGKVSRFRPRAVVAKESSSEHAPE